MRFWSILFGGVILAEIAFVLIAPWIGWGLPTNYSTYGPEIDNLFHLILAITGVAFLLTEGVLVYTMFRFAGKEGRKSQYSHGNHRLEVIWTVVPAVILLFITFAQVNAWGRIKYQSRFPPPDQVFEVSARQFEWRIRYPSADTLQELTDKGAWEKKRADAEKSVDAWVKQPNADDVHAVNEIHIWTGPEGKVPKVRIYLKTRDVLHSFFLPNLRIKQDAVPGKTIPVWFDATEANTKKIEGRWEDGKPRFDPKTEKWVKDDAYIWELACAELCGWGHYKMRGKLFVHESKEDYLDWLKAAANKENQTSP